MTHTLLKKGSRGDEVATLQEMLGIDADGIFGKKTEDSVKAFQKTHGLVADGIVGAKTWAALEAGDKDADIDVVFLPLNRHINKCACRPIKYIAVHYTAGSRSSAGSARAVKQVFEARTASADFAVDDKEICQFNPDLENYYCWSVGDKKNPYSGGGRLYGKATNKNTISIEICSNLKSGFSVKYANHEGWCFTEAALDNALKLIRHLMKKYGIPKSNVVRHYDVSGKLCPGVVGWNDSYVYENNGKQLSRKSDSAKWQAFWARI